MKLFKLSQNVNNGYDTYDSCVVVAENAEQAVYVSPTSYYPEWSEADDDWLMTTIAGNKHRSEFRTWAHPSKLTVEYIGEASHTLTAGTVICASFNAG